jgi:Delta3-Delta2-enoyl-CoA isomerase
MMTRTKDGDVHVLTMQNGENTIDLDFLAALTEHLDAVEADAEGPGALVLTGEGKFFSNGLNLDFLMNASDDQRKQFGVAMMSMMKKLVLFPTPVIAALNGHAFAAGCFLALACDFRIQREDRGWICVSEIDVGVPIGKPMMGLLNGKLTPAVARQAALTGKRYAADDAIAAGFSDAKASESDLLGEATKVAATLAAKERQIFKSIKKELYGEIAARFVLPA